jgi:hypothetical protein
MWQTENGGLTEYTAYNGAYEQGEFHISGDGKIHSDHEVTIPARSGDVAVIAIGKTLSDTPGIGEQGVGMLWINQ